MKIGAKTPYLGQEDVIKVMSTGSWFIVNTVLDQHVLTSFSPNYTDMVLSSHQNYIVVLTYNNSLNSELMITSDQLTVTLLFSQRCEFSQRSLRRILEIQTSTSNFIRWKNNTITGEV